jgi:hypothetical protein
MNLPNYELDDYIVVRLNDGQLWFYGTYEEKPAAEMVAKVFKNGLVVKNES